MNAQLRETLVALAGGIIPADDRDAGAVCVNAGPVIAEKIAAGINASLYNEGLLRAQAHAQEHYARAVSELNASELAALLDAMKESQPVFFRQLRTDVAALYLSDPGVWESIGFPGPSTDRGGYPDFDQRQ